MNLEIEIRGPVTDEGSTRSLIDKLSVDHKTRRVKQTGIFFDVDEDKDNFFVLRITEGKENFEFVNKNRLAGQDGIYDETVVKISLTELSAFLKILEQLGFQNAKISTSERVDIYTPDIVWSFRFGGVFGASWEAEATVELVARLDHDRARVLMELQKRGQELQLTAWSAEEYKRFYAEQWGKVQPTPLGEIPNLRG